jgi:hypothetical protein
VVLRHLSVARPQVAVAKTWTAVVKWVEETGPAGVEALANLERSGEQVTPGALRPALQSLLTPLARRAILSAMATPGARLKDVTTAATTAAKASWVGWHWGHPENHLILDELRMLHHPLPHSPAPACRFAPASAPGTVAFDMRRRWACERAAARCRALTSPLTVSGADPAAMQRWSESVDLKDLKVNLGPWEPSDRQPFPTWESLRKAAVWTRPEFEGRRVALSEHRRRPEPVTAAEGDVVAEDFVVDAMTDAEFEAEAAGAPPKRRLFVYRAGATVPGPVASCVLRCALVLLGEPGDLPAQQLCPQLLAAAAEVPVLLYGHVGPVGAVASGLAAQFPELQRLAVDVWIFRTEGRLGGGESRAVRRQIAILAPAGTVDRTKVCPVLPACERLSFAPCDVPR